MNTGNRRAVTSGSVLWAMIILVVIATGAYFHSLNSKNEQARLQRIENFNPLTLDAYYELRGLVEDALKKDSEIETTLDKMRALWKKHDNMTPHAVWPVDEEAEYQTHKAEVARLIEERKSLVKKYRDKMFMSEAQSVLTKKLELPYNLAPLPPSLPDFESRPQKTDNNSDGWRSVRIR